MHTDKAFSLHPCSSVPPPVLIRVRSHGSQWAYIRRHLVDHEHGGWYQGGLDRQPASRTDLEAHIWKAVHHDGRALRNVARRLGGGRR